MTSKYNEIIKKLLSQISQTAKRCITKNSECVSNIIDKCYANRSWNFVDKDAIRSKVQELCNLNSWVIEKTLCRSTTRFICTRCWLRIFCKLCLSEELNNLIRIDRAVTALYLRVELTHSRKAKQWQRDRWRVEVCTYTEWQQRLCIHAAAHIQHIHIYCEGTTQLLRTYRQTWCSKSIDFSHFQADLHAA